MPSETRAGREELPARRPLTRVLTEHDGHAYFVDYACFPDGRIAEIFVNARKSSSAAEAIARDAAIVLSIALQYAAPYQALRRAMTRDGQGQPLSIVGHALDVAADDAEGAT